MTEREFFKEVGYSDETPDPVYRAHGVVYRYKKVPQTEKHQFIVKRWPPSVTSAVARYELEMVYETREGIWAETKFYGLTFDQLKENLSRLEGCLKAALLYMDANPLHYQFNGED